MATYKSKTKPLVRKLTPTEAKEPRATPLTLEHAVEDLRSQLMRLSSDDPFFRIKGVEVELSVVVETSSFGKGGLNWIVVAGEETTPEGAAHRVRIQFELRQPSHELLIHREGLYEEVNEDPVREPPPPPPPKK